MKKELKISRARLIAMYDVLTGLKRFDLSHEVKATILFNLFILEADYKAIKDTIKPSEEQMEFEKKQLDIIDKYVEEGTSTILASKLDDCIKELTAFREANNEHVVKQEKIDKDVEVFLNMQIDVTLRTISVKDIPTEATKDDFAFNVIIPMVDFNE